MARSVAGLHATILMIVSKILCLDPITQNGGDPTKWTVCSRAFNARMISFLAFFGLFHCKVRVYDVLASPTVTFHSYVLLGCSSAGMFVIISQMLITYFTRKQYVKVMRILRDIYVQESYGMALKHFNTVALLENGVVAIVVVESFISSMVTSHSWHQMITKAILDMFNEVTLAVSTLLYFNTTFCIKKCFEHLYARSKDITDAKCLKLLWKDYLRLHSTVEKVDLPFSRLFPKSKS